MNQALLHEPDFAEIKASSLKDLVRDFISMALLIRRGRDVSSADAFTTSVDGFFSQLERQARLSNYSVEQVRDTQYALCAFLDESVLRAPNTTIRRALEVNSLQLRYFGAHMAGEGFFERLDTLRIDVKGNLDVLEVYHLVLALGFEGKYALGEGDQLRYLANNLGQDIARYRQGTAVLSVDWALPDPVSQMWRLDVPIWLYLALIALACVAVYGVLDWLLNQDVAALATQISQLFSV